MTGLAYCYFAAYHTDGRRKWHWGRFTVLGCAPVLIGLLLTWHLGRPAGDALTIIAAVLSVVAAVLLGLLPLAHSIVGQANIDRKYSAGERPLAQQELDRVQTLQDLHAAISWAVVLLVIALVSCAALALVGAPPEGDEAKAVAWVMYPILVVLYSIMSATVLTFFDVARGVFEGMESHSEAIKGKIRNNVKPPNDDEEDLK